MPRRDRQEAEGALHHVVAQAASDSRIVVDDADRLRFLDELRSVVTTGDWHCIAYCVMTTHVHLVLCTPQPNLGEGMRLLLGRYAFVFNRRHGRRGHLFSHRFWARRIDRPHYLCCAALYAALNPVAAGVCGHPRDFPWSSYRETASAGTDDGGGLVRADLLLRALDEDAARARELYRKLVDDAVARLTVRRREEAWWRTAERLVGETLATG